MTTMGKEASLDGLEFDGDTVLCRVCGDKASGFHYGVHACEGCKGFFRRSIQQKIQYRPCLKNQQCNIMRVNRNRCQYCRLKKCIAVGMSRDAVRFGRVPKKEKARIIEKMHKNSLQSQASQMVTFFQNTHDLIKAIVTAHQQTCAFPLDHVRQMREEALKKQEFVNCPAHMACPLNAHLNDAEDESQGWKDMSEYFTPAIKSVVDFAKAIPGFSLLSQDDQVTLLKAATFEVLLVRLACLFDPDSNSMLFTNGKIFKRPPSQSSSAGFLLDSMFDFADRFNKLNLTDEEIALFSAVVLLSPDRPGLRNTEHLESFQMKLTECLQTVISANHKEDSTLFAKLLMKTTDLRTLNTLHSEKSIGQNDSSRQEQSTTEKGKMDFQEVQFDSSLSEEGSTLSDVSSKAGSGSGATGYDSGVYEGGGAPVLPQRFDSQSHPQVVLKTPYGTFFREDSLGYYGMIPEPQIRRCHTLERDILSRPRLHTIEERRRYTLDKDLIDMRYQRLSDRHEKAALLRGSSMPPSLASSATSSPVPPEFFTYQNRSHEFSPISSDNTSSSARGSPMLNTDNLLTLPSSSPKPGSPNPRSRSGSMGAEDYAQLRPRCYSFHMNSDGRASRFPHDQADNMYVTPEMRRGSVGAAFGLHHRKKSLLVDRHPRYLSRLSDNLSLRKDFAKPSETEKSPRNLAEEADNISSIRIPVPKLAENVEWQSPASNNNFSPISQGAFTRQIKEEKSSAKESANLEEQPMSPMAVDDTSNEENESEISEATSTGEKQSPVTENSAPAVEMFHKKFDKMRKHISFAENPDNIREKRISTDEESNCDENFMEDLTCTTNSEDIPNGDLEKLKIQDELPIDTKAQAERPKSKSAGESHPQLLAQLNSPNPPSVPFQSGFLKLPLQYSQAQTTTQSPIMLNVPRYSVSRSSAAKDLPVLTSHLNSAPAPSQLFSPGNGKEQLHLTTMTHLKDKLMRKYDSTENLTKIGQQSQPANNGFMPEREKEKANLFSSEMKRSPGSMDPTYAQSMASGQQLTGSGLYQAGIMQQHMQMHPAFLASNPGYGSVPPMFMLPGYNQHLAGMQHLAQIYAKSSQEQQKRMEGGDREALNLSSPSTSQASNMSISFGQVLEKKIKEELK